MNSWIFYELSCALLLSVLLGILVWSRAKAIRKESEAAEAQLDKWRLEEPGRKASQEQELADLKAQVPKLNEEIKSLNVEVERLKLQNTSLQADVNQLKNENRPMKRAKLRKVLRAYSESKLCWASRAKAAEYVAKELVELGDDDWVKGFSKCIAWQKLRADMKGKP